MYAWIGRKTVRFAYRYARRRYSRQLRVALGLGAAATAAGTAYLLSREVPEG